MGDEVLVQENEELSPKKVTDISNFTMQGMYYATNIYSFVISLIGRMRRLGKSLNIIFSHIEGPDLNHEML